MNADVAGAGLGYGDWRLPTRAELSSITEREQCFNPAINTTTFSAPESAPNVFPGLWSSTPYALNGANAWAVEPSDGQVAPVAKTGPKYVRLVRAGQ